MQQLNMCVARSDVEIAEGRWAGHRVNIEDSGAVHYTYLASCAAAFAGEGDGAGVPSSQTPLTLVQLSVSMHAPEPRCVGFLFVDTSGCQTNYASSGVLKAAYSVIAVTASTSDCKLGHTA